MRVAWEPHPGFTVYNGETLIRLSELAQRKAGVRLRMDRRLPGAPPSRQHRREDQRTTECADGRMGVPILAHEFEDGTGRRLRQKTAH